ncbi:glycosyltransferase family 4 protein [Terriglobus roseus]|uniref:Glycosyltransferase involved in cell wall bisynthesis n=1 Tax=Terriglobus roseus TaxID=392734 RepID=A0A1H4TX89_9BACT|nr:glycosyltransferase family 4 protein [Terriglobus roseus]SEC60890.1 Glycosyltransferase involved in cell wall bisynthesis [Terriglobus roseus]
MRILHILNDLTNRGNGIVNVAVDLACEQSDSGHDVTVVSGFGDFVPLVQQHGVRWVPVDQSRSIPNLAKATFRLMQILRRDKPDVIHAHMRTGLLLAWLCSRFPRIPLVSHLHNVHDRESNLMRLADRVIAVSQSVMDTMTKTGIPKEKFRVILNGPLGTPRLPKLEDITPEPLEGLSLVTVAGMNYRKGIQELVPAFERVAAQYDKAHLYLVGDGPERTLFEDLVSRSPYSARIHFEGWTSEPQKYMLGCDVFVLASRRESLGLVLLEARHAGCAIIATDVDGIPEALDHGSAGLLVPPENVEALAQALLKVAGDEALRGTMRVAARKGCEKFTCKVMADQTEQIYNELLHATPLKAQRNESETSLPADAAAATHQRDVQGVAD